MQRLRMARCQARLLPQTLLAPLLLLLPQRWVPILLVHRPHLLRRMVLRLLLPLLQIPLVPHRHQRRR